MNWNWREDSLPNNGDTVLIKTNRTNSLNDDGQPQQYHVATFRRGKVPKAGESITNADQHGNNEVPYCWDDAPSHYNGQEVTHWAHITPPPDEREDTKVLSIEYKGYEVEVWKDASAPTFYTLAFNMSVMNPSSSPLGGFTDKDAALEAGKARVDKRAARTLKGEE